MGPADAQFFRKLISEFLDFISVPYRGSAILSTNTGTPFNLECFPHVAPFNG
jgi:hypothetical protein